MAPATKKTTTKRAPRKTSTTAKKASSKTTRTAKKKAAPQPPTFSPEERQDMINHRAYLLAEQRNFENGNEMQDWLMAEIEVDKEIASAC